MSSDEKFTATQDRLNGEKKTPSLSYGSDDDGDKARTVEDKRLLRKLDRKLLPALTLLYLLSFLDRSNGVCCPLTLSSAISSHKQSEMLGWKGSWRICT